MFLLVQRRTKAKEISLFSLNLLYYFEQFHNHLHCYLSCMCLFYHNVMCSQSRICLIYRWLHYLYSPALYLLYLQTYPIDTLWIRCDHPKVNWNILYILLLQAHIPLVSFSLNMILDWTKQIYSVNLFTFLVSLFLHIQ